MKIPKFTIRKAHVFSRKSAKRFAVFTVVFATILGILFNPFARKIDAAWFNDNWQYRQKVSITNSGSALTDFQTSFTLDTATLITAGKMQNDCDDIRITDIGGKLLPHWIDGGSSQSTGCNQTGTKIWTKIPSIPTNGSTLLIYYGNSQAINAENGSKVFEFYDDFESDDINPVKWNSNLIGTSGQSQRVVTTPVYKGSRAVESNQTNDVGDTVIGHTYPTTTNRVLEFSFYDDTTKTGSIYGGHSLSGLVGVFTGVSTTNYSYRVLSTTTASSVTRTTGWHKMKIAYSGSDMTFYIDGTSIGSSTSVINAGTFVYGSYHAAQLGFYADSFYSRKYAATEPTASVSTEEKAQTPVAHWAFDEGQGTTAKDDTPNANNGTLTNGPVWISEDQCISGKCLKFDGSNDYVQMNSTSVVNNSFSMSLWFRTSSSADVKLVSLGASEHPLQIINGTLRTCNMVSNGSAANCTVGTTTINDNKWHFVEVVGNSSNIKVYLDGRTTAEISQSASTYTYTGILRVGAQGGDAGATAAQYVFPGFIDDVKIYNYARSAAQVRSDFVARGDVKGISTVAGGASPNGEILSNGLVGYWKMDESSWTNNCSTTSVTDSSGNANNGTACPNTGGPTGGAVGKFGNAGSFDGSDDYVAVPDSSTLQLTNRFTIATWVKAGSTTQSQKYLLNKGNYYAIIYEYVNDTVEFFTGSGKFTGTDPRSSSAITISDTNWHHIIYTYDGTTFAGYRDGIRIFSTQITFSINSSSGNVSYIGSASINSNLFAGSLDELRIYNRGLSPAEISQLYNFAPGPVAYYDFEEANGTTANDRSGNANTGTLVNGPTWTNGKYGNGIRFDGTDDTVSVPDSVSLSPKQVTIEAWVKPAAYSGSYVRMLSKLSSYDIHMYTFTNAEGRIENDIRVPAETDNVTAFADAMQLNRWYHVAATYDANLGVQRTYINGALKAERTGISGTLTDTASPFTIASTNSTAYFNGTIDDVKVYSYARSQKQVQEDMLGSAGTVLSERTKISNSGIVGYWDFDEGNGTTANNQGNGGSTLNGTLTNMTSPATSTSGWTNNGKANKGLNFDGTNDYVSIPSDSQTNLTNGVTLSAWAYWTGSASASNKAIIIKSFTSSWVSPYIDYGLRVEGTTNTVSFQISDASNTNRSIASRTALQANNWYHIVGTYDGSNLRIYINGKLETSTVLSASTLASSTQPIIIGSDAAGDAFPGKIDEVKLYNYALTSDEVKQDYNHGSSQVLGSTSTTAAGVNDNSSERAYCPPGDTTATCAPVGEWNFEEGSGSSVQDSTGNNNTGTWTGTTTRRYVAGKFGKAGIFNGTSDYVSTALSSVSLGLTNSSITTEAWVKTSTASLTRGIAGKQRGSQYSYGIALIGGSIRGFMRNASTAASCDSSTALPLNMWNHVAQTINDNGTNTTVILYLNGAPIKTCTSQIRIADSGERFYIGAQNDASIFFPGQIDQVSVYNYARSPTQIAWDYNRGAPVAAWDFDECEGTTVNDLSGNGNTGTVNIGATGTQTSAGTCSTSSTAWGNGATGKKNASLNFDGTDDYVTMGNTNNQTTNDFSVSTWVKTTQTAGSGSEKFIITKRSADASTNTGFEIFQNASQSIAYIMSDGSGARLRQDATGPAINDGNWHLIAVTFTRTGSGQIYIDGKRAVSGSGTISTQTGSITNSVNFLVGRDAGTTNPGYWNGQMDEPKFFNYALTSTQVKTLYTDGAVNFSPSTGAP